MVRQNAGIYLITLAMSLSIISQPTWANPPINSVNDGPVINSGLYLNTVDSKTTFTNTAGTGIWLKSGSNLRGVESDSSGNLSGNGGTIQISAPNQAVRLDGNIDIRGVRDGNGQYLGNGGKLFIDSAYLFQGGNIYANGYGGGLVQFNVGSATIAGTARIEANGVGSTAGIGSTPGLFQSHQGGTIAINSRGPVDIQHHVVFDTIGSGGDVNIEGSIVNVEGVVQATATDFNNGTIRLVSTGQTDLAPVQTAIQTATTHGIFSTTEASNINNNLTSLATNHDGDIIVTAPDSINPRGSLAALTIIAAARRNIDNGGWILADGHPSFGTDSGNGGVISLNVGSTITNTGRISANGVGSQGNGGIIALSYKDGFSNSGTISAIGRYTYGGGLIDFSGPVNPTGTGTVAAFGGTSRYGYGTVVMPDPGTTSNRIFGTWAKTQPHEVVFGGSSFGGVIFMNTSLPGSTVTNGSFDDWFAHGRVRNLFDQLGYGEARTDIQSYYSHVPDANPLIVSSNDGSSFNLTYPGKYLSLGTATSLTVLTNGSVTVPNIMQIGFDYPKGFLGNGYAESLRGHLSILSDSLAIQPTGGFTISGKTNYLLDEVKPETGAPYVQVLGSYDMGPGTADIAVKTSFTGSSANFSLDRQDPSLIIKAPN